MTKIKCKKCNYEWEFKGMSRFAVCPRCHSSNETMSLNDFLEKINNKKDDKQ